MEGKVMTDVSTKTKIRVSIDEIAGPYIRVSVVLLEKVRALLAAGNVPHWIDHHAISVDGRDALAVIYLGKKIDPSQVQTLLDSAA
jgi:hypothetical protein